MQFTYFSFLASIAATAFAFNTPDTQKFPNPSGNAVFTPGKDAQILAGQPFEITWNASTPGTVTILLNRGPTIDVQPIYAIAEEIQNSGKYVWTPKTDLKPQTSEYSITIVVDATRQYQYSNQFGIKNPGYESSSTSTSSTSSKDATSTVVVSKTSTSTSAKTTVTTTRASETSSDVITTSTKASTTIITSTPPVSSTSTPVPTTADSMTTSMRQTTGAVTSRPAATTSATTSVPPQATNAAMGMAANVGLTVMGAVGVILAVF